MKKWVVPFELDGLRLATFVRKMGEACYSLKDIRWTIEHHRCRVNGTIERFCSRALAKGDCVEIDLEKKPHFLFEPTRLLYEDEGILFYDKQPGISSEELSKLLNLKLIHRLDRDTTGVIFFAKNQKMAELGESLFRERLVKKNYLALVRGEVLESKGIIENYIGKIGEREGEGVWGVVDRARGAYAKTVWKRERRNQNFSLIRCFPLTGRTHQIRVHLSRVLRAPVFGDLRYGGRQVEGAYVPFRPLLHSASLSFVHPLTKVPLDIHAPLPDDFREGLRECFDRFAERDYTLQKN